MRYAATGLSIPPDSNNIAFPEHPAGSPCAPGMLSKKIYEYPFSLMSTFSSKSYLKRSTFRLGDLFSISPPIIAATSIDFRVIFLSALLTVTRNLPLFGETEAAISPISSRFVGVLTAGLMLCMPKTFVSLLITSFLSESEKPSI